MSDTKDNKESVAITGVVKNISDDVVKLHKEVEEKAKLALEKVEDEIVDNTIDLAKDKLENVKDVIEDKHEDVKEKAGDLKERFLNAVSSAKRSLCSCVSGLLKKEDTNCPEDCECYDEEKKKLNCPKDCEC
tara:strand:+ start:2773 stop:3168 length:396 start_codon:yes stop_codon:yes gene_type:complete